MKEARKILKKFYGFIYFLFLFQGCALSGLTQMEMLEAETSDMLSDEIAIEFYCGPKTYSVMASLIVPLPPIIPVFIDSDPQIFLTHPSWVTVESMSLQNQDGKQIELQFVEDRPKLKSDDRIVSLYIAKGGCDCLGDSNLEFKAINRETGVITHIKVKIIYSAGELTFEWDYLSA
ncbi:hypothetical protein [Hahella chejuensis]|uniref:hypothetical protein n=1 Tax=Hahella chejuensis TaxID=158327 RepID=UPI0005A02233|nr:hypothetical protein [Hahella chejuensis]